MKIFKKQDRNKKNYQRLIFRPSTSHQPIKTHPANQQKHIDILVESHHKTKSNTRQKTNTKNLPEAKGDKDQDKTQDQNQVQDETKTKTINKLNLHFNQPSPPPTPKHPKKITSLNFLNILQLFVLVYKQDQRPIAGLQQTKY